MRIVENNIIPFEGFLAINLFGVMFVRKGKKHKISERTIRHEQIHTAQMREMLYVFFYLWYLIEWLIRLPFSNAYVNVSFEREAYINDNSSEYLNNRKPYSWMKYL